MNAPRSNSPGSARHWPPTQSTTLPPYETGRTMPVPPWRCRHGTQSEPLPFREWLSLLPLPTMAMRLARRKPRRESKLPPTTNATPRHRSPCPICCTQDKDLLISERTESDGGICGTDDSPCPDSKSNSILCWHRYCVCDSCAHRRGRGRARSSLCFREQQQSQGRPPNRNLLVGGGHRATLVATCSAH